MRGAQAPRHGFRRVGVGLDIEGGVQASCQLKLSVRKGSEFRVQACRFRVEASARPALEGACPGTTAKESTTATLRKRIGSQHDLCANWC